ncbi:MAG: MMPL family transporter [Dehalococcoidia bacterium]
MIGAWTAAIVLLGLIVSTREPVFTSHMQLTDFPESQRVLQAVEELRGAERLIEMIVVSQPTLTVEDEQFRAFVAGLVEALRSEPEALNGEQTTSYFEMVAAGSPFAAGLVSQDRSIALVRTMIRGELDDSAGRVDVLNRVIEETRQGSGFAVLAGGFATAVAAFEDLASERYVLPIALLILVAVSGAVAAALMPEVLPEKYEARRAFDLLDS